jgi:hypothetical protein
MLSLFPFCPLKRLHIRIWQIGLPGTSPEGKVVSQGNYAPFPYRYWGYCKVTRNAIEESINPSLVDVAPSSPHNADTKRILEPTLLCFVTEEQFGRCRSVAEWKNDPENQQYHRKCLEYLFIANTAEHFNENSPEDVCALYEIATKATRDEGLRAYRDGMSCMNPDTFMQDVFRISDIVSGLTLSLSLLDLDHENLRARPQ